MKRVYICLAVAFITFTAVCAQGSDKLTGLELVAKHLDSLGPVEVRDALKSRVADGLVEYNILSGGAGRLSGKMYLASGRSKYRFSLDFSDPHYPENFLYDGNAVTVTNSPRSAFGEFVYTQAELIRDGIFGGVLSAEWALLI